MPVTLHSWCLRFGSNGLKVNLLLLENSIPLVKSFFRKHWTYRKSPSVRKLMGKTSEGRTNSISKMSPQGIGIFLASKMTWKNHAPLLLLLGFLSVPLHSRFSGASSSPPPRSAAKSSAVTCTLVVGECKLKLGWVHNTSQFLSIVPVYHRSSSQWGHLARRGSQSCQISGRKNLL